MLVTSNKGKFEEYEEILSREGIELKLKYMAYPEEQVDTLEEVAERSAIHLSRIIRGEFIIDDSGLFIQELKGFPGVYSSYVNRTIGNSGILRMMEGARNRRASFSTCIAYYDGSLRLFRGDVDGAISLEERGSNGFGFDPIFVPDGHDKTYAEMSIKMKNSLSHRSKAAEAFVDFFKKKNI